MLLALVRDNIQWLHERIHRQFHNLLPISSNFKCLPQVYFTFHLKHATRGHSPATTGPNRARRETRLRHSLLHLSQCTHEEAKVKAKREKNPLVITTNPSIQNKVTKVVFIRQPPPWVFVKWCPSSGD